MKETYYNARLLLCEPNDKTSASSAKNSRATGRRAAGKLVEKVVEHVEWSEE